MRDSIRRRNITGALAAFLLAAMVVLPAAAHGTVDQANEGPFDNGVRLFITTGNAQSFTPSLAYTTGFDVFVYNRTGSDVNATFRGWVREGSLGPVVAVAEGAAIVPATANQPWLAQRVHLDLPSPVALSGTHTLWLAQFDLEPKLRWALTHHNPAGPYPGGQWCAYPAGCVPNLRAYDFGFVTYGSENQPPDCTAAAPSQEAIWPPNHQMEGVTIDGVTDPDGDPVTVAIDAIHQDEPVNAIGDAATTTDGAGIGTPVARVRAERAGDGDGRVYVIAYTASDDKGAACSGQVTVGVPHDQRPDGDAVDSGLRYDSTTP